MHHHHQLLHWVGYWIMGAGALVCFCLTGYGLLLFPRHAAASNDKGTALEKKCALVGVGGCTAGLVGLVITVYISK
jgi:hypothetical protein